MFTPRKLTRKLTDDARAGFNKIGKWLIIIVKILPMSDHKRAKSFYTKILIFLKWPRQLILCYIDVFNADSKPSALRRVTLISALFCARAPSYTQNASG